MGEVCETRQLFPASLGDSEDTRGQLGLKNKICRLLDVSKTPINTFRLNIFEKQKKNNFEQTKVCEASQLFPVSLRESRDTRGQLTLENFLGSFSNKKLLEVSKTPINTFRLNIFEKQKKKNWAGEGVRG